jgi:2-oxoisovalerate dehydrogenase E1 component
MALTDNVDARASSLPVDAALQLYRWIRTARSIDELERELVARGEAFFHVSGAGHEATAVLAQMLTPEDYLHCHYRDKALLLARGISIIEFFNSLLCNGSSHSLGRQMSAHLSAPTMNVLSLAAPVGNNALQAVGIAHQIKTYNNQPIAVCCIGDGATQQGEVLEAIAESVRWQLPLMFLIEDNNYSISTTTKQRTFYSTPEGELNSFYALPIHRVDGTNVAECREKLGLLAKEVRTLRHPALCVMRVERLSAHTNADDESVYRDREELDRVRATADPLAKLRIVLIAEGASESEIDALDDMIDMEVRGAADAALDQSPPVANTDAKLPISTVLTDRKREYRGTEGGNLVTMGSAIREVLRSTMNADPRVTLYGQDIEDPKGDVFGVTRGLSTSFPDRVNNSPLSESTIIGTSIGRALAGGRPVAFLQFADFLPLAFNQLASELGSLAWRTNGGWRAPVIVMVACGGYRPGLGPFHAGSFESVIAHVPGIDVALPSTATDAAGILNAAFQSERPTVLFYPKALLNDPARATSSDVAQQFVPIGVGRIVCSGSDLTIVAWGNTVPLCEKVAATLLKGEVTAEVIDLRWLSPWDTEMVCASASKTGRLLVVHEDNITAGFGAEIIAAVNEAVPRRVECRRVARPDTYIPCHFPNQLEVLPSLQSILTTAAVMCDLDLTWEESPPPDVRRQILPVIGSSPADQAVEVVELNVKIGDTVVAGQIIATLEADKAAVELAAPIEGVVESIHLSVGDKACVDAPFITLRVAPRGQRQLMHGDRVIAHLKGRTGKSLMPNATARCCDVFLTAVRAVRGLARLPNTELANRMAFRGSEEGDDIFDRTGIETRLVADQSQDAVTMATEAAAGVLSEVEMEPHELSLVICCTTTPLMISPSTACQVLHRLAPAVEVAAYDLQAACSGYLYALAGAWDYLQTFPDTTVLILTTETMRQIVDIHDPDTSPIFADAATATLLTTENGRFPGLAVLRRPVLSARGEGGTSLRVPLPGPGAFVHMDGKKIFAEAVRRMPGMLAQACAQSRLTVDHLDLIVPHQANGRILEALRTRLKVPPHRLWNEIRLQGNTSSSSIPLALTTVLYREKAAKRIGLCAFGAGYTFGAAILDRSDSMAFHHLQEMGP